MLVVVKATSCRLSTKISNSFSPQALNELSTKPPNPNIYFSVCFLLPITVSLKCYCRPFMSHLFLKKLFLSYNLTKEES